MHRATFSLTVAGLLALAACTTSPIAPEQAQPVPADRLLAFTGPAGDQAGALIVTRDGSGPMGGCFVALWINGQLAGRFDPAERARFEVPAGEVLLKVGRDPMGRGACAIGPEIWTQRESSIKAGERKLYRIELDILGRVDIHRAER